MKSTPNAGKPPLRARTEPASTPSVPTKNVMGDGRGGAAQAKGHVQSHGERCASAGGHIMGKGY